MILPTSFFKRLLFLVKVEGTSMFPALLPGRSYFASAIGSIREGDLIVFRNPRNTSRIFVKKVAKKETGGYFVEGLCADSSSSRDFGTVPESLILGKIIA